VTALAAACAVCSRYLGATLEQLPSKGHHSQQHISTSIVHKQDSFAVGVLLEAAEDGIKVIQDLVTAAATGGGCHTCVVTSHCYVSNRGEIDRR